MIRVTWRRFGVYLLAVAAFEGALQLLRMTLEHYQHATILRIQMLSFLEFVMLFCDAVIWNRISFLVQNYNKRVKDALKSALILMMLLAHACFGVFYIVQSEEPRLLVLISFISIAFHIHMSVVFGFFDIMELIGDACCKIGRGDKARRRHTKEALLIVVVLVGVGLYTTSQPPSVKRVTVPIKHLPTSLNGLRIALLTDIHVGPTVGKRRVQELVNVVNGAMPDVVTISGDLTDGYVEHLGGAMEPLALLKAPLGVYFSTGNHEYYHGRIDDWIKKLTELKVRTLRNEHVRLNRLGVESDSSLRALCMAGVDDISAMRSGVIGHGMNVSQALNGCRPDDTTILLSHQPHGAQRALQGKNGNEIDLVLSGHTHGGQMYVLAPFMYLINPYFVGLYKDDATGAHVYVSAGVNYWGPPVKVYGTTEVTLLTLVNAE